MESLILLLALCGQVQLDGPVAANVNEKVQVEVTGLPTFDLTKPLGESLTWTETMKFVVSAPDDKTRLDSTIGMDFLSKQWRLTLTFQPKSPGTYVIIAGPDLITHRVQVGGAVPPGPNPPGPLPPVKNPKVTILRETKTQTPEEAAMIIKLRIALPKAVIMDKDDSPKLYDKTKSLPQLVVSDGDVVLFNDSFKDADEAVKKVTEYGLR